MSAAQKRESPAATGLNAEKITNVAIVALPSSCDKPNLIARLTRAGHLVHEGSEHSFTVVHPRWGMSRYCADFGALQSFARTIGALA